MSALSFRAMWRAPDAEGHAWTRTPYRQLRMLRGTPGPEHHIASSKCCGARQLQMLWSTPGPECQKEGQTECQNRCEIECQKECQNRCQIECKKNTRSKLIYHQKVAVFHSKLLVCSVSQLSHVICKTLQALQGWKKSYGVGYPGYVTVSACWLRAGGEKSEKTIENPHCNRVGTSRGPPNDSQVGSAH